jgi:hypothetical protein
MSAIESAAATSAQRAALVRLAEGYQNQHRLVATLEEQIRRLQGALGRSTDTITIADLLATAQQNRSPQSFEGRAVASKSRPMSWPHRTARPLRPNAGNFNHALNAKRTAVVGFDVRGSNRDALARILADITSRQSEVQSFTPLFFYDGTGFDLFRRHGFVFERLASRHNRMARPTIDWAAEDQRRLAIAVAKWSIQQVVDMRPTA